MKQPIIALLTDFGVQDRYVGVMKGVMRGICPDAQFIDITHEITPQHVRQAAFQLMDAYKYFPEGTVFLVVVDPGVGSTRLPIAVQTGPYIFVAPDNGVLSYALGNPDECQVIELNKSEFWLDSPSHTFHGRDIFSPVAAHLAAGRSLNEVGTPVQNCMMLTSPALSVTDDGIAGEVLDIDRFGNIITSVGRLSWISDNRLTLTSAFDGTKNEDVPVLADEAKVSVGGHTVASIKTSYSEVSRGDVLALVGSSGFLEIAVNQGNAAHRLDAVIGDPIQISVGDIDAAILD